MPAIFESFDGHLRSLPKAFVNHPETSRSYDVTLAKVVCSHQQFTVGQIVVVSIDGGGGGRKTVTRLCFLILITVFAGIFCLMQTMWMVDVMMQSILIAQSIVVRCLRIANTGKQTLQHTNFGQTFVLVAQCLQ